MPKSMKAIFGGKETKKEEAAERKAAGSKKKYAEMEAKYEPGMHKTKKMMGGGMAYAKGGGIESKGKTKGKMVKMMGGGKC